MGKRFKGYCSIEASLVMPMVLFLYLLIILSALYLYCRCTITQDIFLLGMRAGCFTYGTDDYGEVIYGQAETWQAENYVERRLNDRKQRYPLYFYQEGYCKMEQEWVRMETWYQGNRAPYVTRIQKYDPIRMIKEGRKN